jgi:hypothetical protein
MWDEEIDRQTLLSNGKHVFMRMNVEIFLVCRNPGRILVVPYPFPPQLMREEK